MKDLLEGGQTAVEVAFDRETMDGSPQDPRTTIVEGAFGSESPDGQPQDPGTTIVQGPFDRETMEASPAKKETVALRKAPLDQRKRAQAGISAEQLRTRGLLARMPHGAKLLIASAGLFGVGFGAVSAYKAVAGGSQSGHLSESNVPLSASTSTNVVASTSGTAPLPIAPSLVPSASASATSIPNAPTSTATSELPVPSIVPVAPKTSVAPKPSAAPKPPRIVVKPAPVKKPPTPAENFLTYLTQTSVTGSPNNTKLLEAVRVQLAQPHGVYVQMEQLLQTGSQGGMWVLPKAFSHTMHKTSTLTFCLAAPTEEKSKDLSLEFALGGGASSKVKVPLTANSSHPQIVAANALFDKSSLVIVQDPKEKNIFCVQMDPCLTYSCIDPYACDNAAISQSTLNVAIKGSNNNPFGRVEHRVQQCPPAPKK